ncbi:hypothetical protein GCM10012287_56500 [Streptomyces daqingensis]|uniref:Methyltransferase FkbM domain-containing protein n=2 Tax=Streptomyces daqingensis TaxID=1472640 RepID=A0ABQ2MTM3_9ACTN|nr:hypothetical protein GCM10012287_56500 [Streptomyces daqingensis]
MGMRGSGAPFNLWRWYLRNAPGSLGTGAIATRLNSYLMDHPRSAVVPAHFSAHLEVDTVDLIQRFLYMFGVWEPHLTHWLQQRLKPGDVFIDVGANIGYFSVLGSSLVGPDGLVVAVEASPTFHRKLSAHAHLNDCGNLRPINAAVSDKEETLRLILVSSRNMGASSVVPYVGPTESEVDVEGHPLPQLLSDKELERARVIKIDVEGAEGTVVRSLKPVLGRLRSDVEVVVEVTPKRMSSLGDSADELVKTFTDRGFRTYRLINDYDPRSYPAAIRHPRTPVRWDGPVTEEMDLVFSRVDARALP